MRRMVVVLGAVAMVAGVVASRAPASGQAEKQTRDDLAGTLARREVHARRCRFQGTRWCRWRR
jgi:hypothetical protein